MSQFQSQQRHQPQLMQQVNQLQIRKKLNSKLLAKGTISLSQQTVQKAAITLLLRIPMQATKPLSLQIPHLMSIWAHSILRELLRFFTISALLCTRKRNTCKLSKTLKRRQMLYVATLSFGTISASLYCISISKLSRVWTLRIHTALTLNHTGISHQIMKNWALWTTWTDSN